MSSAQHPYWLVFVSMGLALTPLLVGLFTSFMKIHIVLSFFRAGLGAQQVPGGLVLLGISFALTLSVMHPTIDDFHTRLKTFPVERLSTDPLTVAREEMTDLFSPWRDFLRRHSGTRELKIFSDMNDNPSHNEAQGTLVEKESRDSWTVLLPAFVVTELKEAFLMGFVIMIPFLVIDLIVANILAGIGMFMVSPVMISLPLKIALFTFADGWLLLTTGLVQSYRLTGGV